MCKARIIRLIFFKKLVISILFLSHIHSLRNQNFEILMLSHTYVSAESIFNFEIFRCMLTGGSD